MTEPRSVLAAAAVQLDRAGVGSPRTDAELLLAHVLDTSRAGLVLIDTVPPDRLARLADLLRRRAAREPLQYLLGSAPFRHVELRVGPGVFVPRPETELLVDAVLPRLSSAPGPIVVDLCAGSGALALAIADEVPTAEVHAVERSPAALRWLRRNASRAEDRVRVVACDVADPSLLSAPDLLAGLRGRVTAVVSNPPYVPDGTLVGAEVAHDPPRAVFAGPDGMVVLPSVITVAADLLRPDGILAVEHDDTHEQAVPALLAADGRWREIRDHRDLAGRPRFATAIRASAD